MTDWRSIPGFPGYQASEDGRIRRVRACANGWRPRELTGHVANTGYRVVGLMIDGEKLSPAAVHKLVALAFHGLPPSEEHQVAHGDGDPTNNSAENLRWTTAKGNAKDRRKHGRDTIGERHGKAKLTASEVIEIIDLYKRGMKQRDIGARFGIHQAQVHRIVTRKSWKHLRLPVQMPIGGLFGRKVA